MKRLLAGLLVLLVVGCNQPSSDYIQSKTQNRVYLPILSVSNPSPLVGVWIDGGVGQQVNYLAPGGLVEVSTRYNNPGVVEQLQVRGYRVIVGVHSQTPIEYSRWAALKPFAIEVLSDGFLNEPEVYLTPQEYASLLTQVYPMIKIVSPTTQVIAGALISPTNGWWEDVYSLSPRSFDVVSYHSYTDWPNLTLTRVCEGGDYLRQFGKPVYLTETAVRCSRNCGSDFLAGQVVYFLALKSSSCFDMFAWYTLADNGWMETDMVYKTPRPVWYQYKDMK